MATLGRDVAPPPDPDGTQPGTGGNQIGAVAAAGFSTDRIAAQHAGLDRFESAAGDHPFEDHLGSNAHQRFGQQAVQG